MNSIRRDVLANYLGQGWAALMGFAFVPLYASTLGIESFGLIGVFTLIQAWVALLDFGLTPSLTRAMARFRSGAHTSGFIRDLIRSLEVVYALLALLCIALLWSGAKVIASRWLNVGHLDRTVVISSLHVMSVVIALRWLEQVYRGALQGMQDQVWLNLVLAVSATLRWVGAYVLVAQITPSIVYFFLWQGGVSALTIFVLVLRTYALLPHTGEQARFSPSALRQVAGFASGMFVGSLLSLLLSQGDKLVISKLLPLSEFGAYMLATTAAMGVLQLILPMNAAIYPHLTRMTSDPDTGPIVATYHSACEWMAALIVPPALVLAFFAEPALVAWTGDSNLAARVSPLLSVLVMGTLCNGFMNLPYMLQLAHGWTLLSVKVNAIAIMLLAPFVLWAVPRFGAMGGAIGWLTLNIGYLMFSIHFMHARLIPGEKRRWYIHALIRPLVVGALVAGALRWMAPHPGNRLAAALTVISALFIVLPCVAWSLRIVRESVQRTICGKRHRPQA